VVRLEAEETDVRLELEGKQNDVDAAVLARVRRCSDSGERPSSPLSPPCSSQLLPPLLHQRRRRRGSGPGTRSRGGRLWILGGAPSRRSSGSSMPRRRRRSPRSSGFGLLLPASSSFPATAAGHIRDGAHGAGGKGTSSFESATVPPADVPLSSLPSSPSFLPSLVAAKLGKILQGGGELGAPAGDGLLYPRARV
jgi:hypothetical protein